MFQTSTHNQGDLRGGMGADPPCRWDRRSRRHVGPLLCSPRPRGTCYPTEWLIGALDSTWPVHRDKRPVQFRNRVPYIQKVDECVGEGIGSIRPHRPWKGAGRCQKGCVGRTVYAVPILCFRPDILYLQGLPHLGIALDQSLDHPTPPSRCCRRLSNPPVYVHVPLVTSWRTYHSNPMVWVFFVVVAVVVVAVEESSTSSSRVVVVVVDSLLLPPPPARLSSSQW
mmetsp:Transcript_8184/g.16443  ORF Transcript_8184/g.16443 Transcript_8184/m.16443 type:complete len:225 (-) Transcript_8184:169-843(-)